MSSRKKVRLLVVDDHEAYCDLIRSSSELWNSFYDIECEFAQSVRDAVGLISEWSPTVILLDAFLSDAESFELIDLMKDAPVPLVVTADHSTSELREMALSRGAKDYFSKSQDPDDIEVMLTRVATIASEEADHTTH